MVMWQPQVKKHCNESGFYLTLSPLVASNHSPWMTAYTSYACASAWYRRLSAFWNSFCYLCIKSQSHVRLATVKLERLCQGNITLKTECGKIYRLSIKH